MLRMCALTVFTDTDSSAAISCRDRFVGRYRSTFSSPALISGHTRDESAGLPPLLRRHPGLAGRGDVADPPDEHPDRMVQLGQAQPDLPGAVSENRSIYNTESTPPGNQHRSPAAYAQPGTIEVAGAPQRGSRAEPWS